MEPSTRQMGFWLAEPERRLLRGLARRLPDWVLPNHLTGVGVIGALGTGAAYALSSFDVRWLLVAVVMLAINWFGDSLDGTVARVRGIERPRYGYYLDHLVDAFNTAFVGVGIGLSPFVSLEVALVLIVVYLTLSINVYLETTVFGVFRMAYGRVGPTEGRLVLMGLNAVLVVGGIGIDGFTHIAGRIGNGVLAVLAAAMCTLLLVRFASNLRALARLEPSNLRPVQSPVQVSRFG